MRITKITVEDDFKILGYVTAIAFSLALILASTIGFFQWINGNYVKFSNIVWFWIMFIFGCVYFPLFCRDFKKYIERLKKIDWLIERLRDL